MPLESDTKLLHYQLIEKIGEGGMGVVWRALDMNLDRQVAIKVLPDDFAADPERLARFEREAKLLAALDHPNLATVHGLHQAVPSTSSGEAPVPFLAMELVPGEDLQQRLQRGPVPLDETLRIAEQIAAGMEAAHDRGVIHRDLKPANIKLTPDGRVKILDLGLAKALAGPPGDSGTSLSASPTMTAGLTAAGVLLGTAAYMSPEQARGQPMDRRSDLWAFGVILFEMLSGERMFSGPSVSDVLAGVLKTAPDWNRLPPETPASVRRVLRRCLTPEVEHRQRHFGDVGLELREAAEEGVDTATDMVVTAAPAARGLPWLWAVVLLLAAVAAGAFLMRTLVPAQPNATGAAINLDLILERPLDSSGFPRRKLALSPDGSRLVFVAQLEGGDTQLYQRLLDRRVSEPMIDTEGARSPFFSPDGRYVAFFAQGQLKKVSVSGGKPLTLAVAPGFPQGGDWAGDDIIFVTNNMQPHLIAAGGGTAQPVPFHDENMRANVYAWPRFLPDGRRILISYWGELLGRPGPHILTLSLETGEHRFVVEGSDGQYVESGHLLFERDNAALVAPFDPVKAEVIGPQEPVPHDIEIDNLGALTAEVSPNGMLFYVPRHAVARGSLVWVTRDGSVTPVTDERNYAIPRLSPDGAHVILGEVSVETGDLWVLDLQRESSTRLTFDGYNGYPAWSPDGRDIVFTSNRGGGAFSIYRMRATGGVTPERLQRPSRAFHTQVPLSFSPDGAELLYYQIDTTTVRDLWVWSAEWDEPRPVATTPFNERGGQFSPDGRWIAYVSDESGQDEIYVQSYPTVDGRWKVSTDGGREVRWRGDGRELYYRKDQSMMAVAFAPGDALQVSEPRELFRGSFLADNFGNGNYDVTHDGQRFLMMQGAEQRPAHLKVVMNWFEELERPAPAGK